MKCKLCPSESAAASGLCRYHEAARENVEAAYASWQDAYGELGRKSYLDRIKRNHETGQWAKEVAESLEGDHV